MLQLLNPTISQYRDRRFVGGQEEFEECLRTSTTLYIGNLSFYTTEEQILEVWFLLCRHVHQLLRWSSRAPACMQLFSTAGWVKRIVMGLDKVKRTPCGFCFVEYHTREDAADAVKYINGAQLDERPIRVDFDWGFQEGRQYGRGRGGGQVCCSRVPGSGLSCKPILRLLLPPRLGACMQERTGTCVHATRHDPAPVSSSKKPVALPSQRCPAGEGRVQNRL